MKFAVIHHLPGKQVEIVGFRLHNDRTEASLLAGILNDRSGTSDFTMYEMTPCAPSSPASIAQAIADLK